MLVTGLADLQRQPHKTTDAAFGSEQHTSSPATAGSTIRAGLGDGESQLVTVPGGRVGLLCSTSTMQTHLAMLLDS